MKLGWKIIISIIVCQLVGIAGAIGGAGEMETWYQSLTLPSFNPPGWLFGPVWTVLYALMGISFALIWNKKEPYKKAKQLFIAQLIFNGLWSFIFFTWHMPLVALVDIILLLIMILLTIVEFKKIDKTASYLLVPYLLWVSFATVLNAAIVHLN